MKKEIVLIQGVKLSSPERLIYRKEKINKFDVAKYYEKVSERMLPYLNKRLLSVVRCHQGVEGESFFKKHPATSMSGIKIVSVKNDKGEEHEYFYIQSAKGLVGEVQLGTIEFHLWGAKCNQINKPDMMVFDLDPDKKLSLEKTRQGVSDLKSILDELGLLSFLKTSGGKGYHVVVPFSSSSNWENFSEFARQIATLMESKWPELYTTNIRKLQRKGKIFIDFLRNTKGATSVAPYSLRARKGAAVSMPIPWEKLKEIKPDEVKMKDAVALLALPDPWEKFFLVKQSLQ